LLTGTGCTQKNAPTEISLDLGNTILLPHESDGRTVIKNFRIVNNSTADETLNLVSQSCGCFKIEFGSRKVAPGAAIDAMFSMKVTSQSASFTNHAIFRWGSSPPIRLKASGKVYQSISINVEPSGFLEVSDVEDLRIKASISFVSQATGRRIYPEVSFSAALQHSGPATVFEQNHDGIVRIVKEFDLSISPQAFGDLLVLEQKLLAKNGNIELDHFIKLKRLESIRVRPRSLILQSEPGLPVRKSFELSSDEPFSIALQSTGSPSINVIAKENVVSNKHLVLIEWTPLSSILGIQKQTEISFVTTNRSQPKLQVTIHMVLPRSPQN
jgi:hypothetical protein